MTRFGTGWVALGLGLFLLIGVAGSVAAQQMAPPGGDYKRASELAPLPDFLSGLGTLYVKPQTLPVGPFLAYDRQGHLVSTVYMVPLAEIETHKKLDLEAATDLAVDHVDMSYNAGHPGAPEPHYHIILWYIPSAEAGALK